MVHRIPFAKAQTNLGSVVRRVRNSKEYFILEKDGIPVAGVMDAGELEDYLESRDPQVQRRIEESNADVRAGRTRPARDLLLELRSGSAAAGKGPSRGANKIPRRNK